MRSMEQGAGRMERPTHPGLRPSLFIEGIFASWIEIPSIKRGARQGGVCWFDAEAAP
jgi:hypothetical protein